MNIMNRSKILLVAFLALNGISSQSFASQKGIISTFKTGVIASVVLLTSAFAAPTLIEATVNDNDISCSDLQISLALYDLTACDLLGCPSNIKTEAEKIIENCEKIDLEKVVALCEWLQCSRAMTKDQKEAFKIFHKEFDENMYDKKTIEEVNKYLSITATVLNIDPVENTKALINSNSTLTAD